MPNIRDRSQARVVMVIVEYTRHSIVVIHIAPE